ncbi:7171_t:CDS:1, partial [Funneliformis mosseae]
KHLSEFCNLDDFELDNLEKISIDDVYNEHIIKITKLLVHTLKIDSLKLALVIHMS